MHAIASDVYEVNTRLNFLYSENEIENFQIFRATFHPQRKSFQGRLFVQLSGVTIFLFDIYISKTHTRSKLEQVLQVVIKAMQVDSQS